MAEQVFPGASGGLNPIPFVVATISFYELGFSVLTYGDMEPDSVGGGRSCTLIRTISGSGEGFFFVVLFCLVRLNAVKQSK